MVGSNVSPYEGYRKPSVFLIAIVLIVGFPIWVIYMKIENNRKIKQLDYTINEKTWSGIIWEVFSEIVNLLRYMFNQPYVDNSVNIRKWNQIKYRGKRLLDTGAYTKDEVEEIINTLMYTKFYQNAVTKTCFFEIREVDGIDVCLGFTDDGQCFYKNSSDTIIANKIHWKELLLEIEKM